jgi:hypothetical protein
MILATNSKASIGVAGFPNDVEQGSILVLAWCLVPCMYAEKHSISVKQIP